MSAELDANFTAFEARWLAQWTAAEHAFKGDEQYKLAFRRLVSMQAWRSEILEERMSQGAGQFVLEGQNDLLIAYICARTGQWRAALQAQRAALESYFNALYFMDHPVELELWSRGKFKTRFSENLSYLEGHPLLLGLNSRLTGLEILKQEYATLSMAVHGSAKSFRMTKDSGPKYFVVDGASKGQWVTRNKLIMRGLNLLLLSLFRDSLSATKKRNLRKSVSFSLRAKDKCWIKEAFGVTIPFD